MHLTFLLGMYLPPKMSQSFCSEWGDVRSARWGGGGGGGGGGGYPCVGYEDFLENHWQAIDHQYLGPYVAA